VADATGARGVEGEEGTYWGRRITCSVRIEPEEKVKGGWRSAIGIRYVVSTTRYLRPSTHPTPTLHTASLLLQWCTARPTRTLNKTLDMRSIVPNYRRSTRYRSLDGSNSCWLAVHDIDTGCVELYMGAVAMDTQLAYSMGMVKVFDAANWKLGVDVRCVDEKSLWSG
jgi:hypothetical protein